MITKTMKTCRVGNTKFIARYQTVSNITVPIISSLLIQNLWSIFLHAIQVCCFRNWFDNPTYLLLIQYNTLYMVQLTFSDCCLKLSMVVSLVSELNWLSFNDSINDEYLIWHSQELSVFRACSLSTWWRLDCRFVDDLKINLIPYKIDFWFSIF